MTPIYLDHNSTTPIDPRVVDAMCAAWNSGFLNPASQHREGQRARRELETLRTGVIDLLGGKSRSMTADQLIITSGGTESNNLALLGLARHARQQDPRRQRVLVSAVEHPSIIGALDVLYRDGFSVDKVGVDSQGVLRLDELESKLSSSAPAVAVMSLMLANNETGVIEPVHEAVSLCHEKGTWLHTDAVQVVGKLPVNFTDLGCDALSFTAHKLHGPRGIGGLLLRHGMIPEPLLFGGFQQQGIRPGTEDVALLTGMKAALDLASNDNGRAARMIALRESFEASLLSTFPDATINGIDALRLPHTTNVSFPSVDRQAFLMAADFAGLAISTGSACASGSSDPSPVLLAMGANNDVVRGSIRISIGATSTPEELADALDRIVKIVEKLSKSG